MSHGSGLRPLASATLSILDPQWDSSQYPVVTPSHGDPAVLVLQAQHLHMVQQFLDEVDAGVSQLKALDLGLSGS